MTDAIRLVLAALEITLLLTLSRSQLLRFRCFSLYIAVLFVYQLALPVRNNPNWLAMENVLMVARAIAVAEAFAHLQAFMAPREKLLNGIIAMVTAALMIGAVWELQADRVFGAILNVRLYGLAALAGVLLWAQFPAWRRADGIDRLHGYLLLQVFAGQIAGALSQPYLADHSIRSGKLWWLITDGAHVNLAVCCVVWIWMFTADSARQTAARKP